MGLLDLSYVTTTITNLIGTVVNASAGSTALGNVTVSAQPPDLVKAGQTGSNILGFYLYHVAEDPHFRNLPAAGNDSAAVRYSPMGLVLHYQLTAHAEETENGILQEQTMMGLAIKALHDYPLIDNATEVNGVKIVKPPTAEFDIPLRISLMSLPYSEAVSYWTAGSTPLRLAAYYEVSVALLEAEEFKSRATRVLTYNVFAGIEGIPRLTASCNSVLFTVPGKSERREAILQPAEVSYGQTVTFKGSDIGGRETVLLLTNTGWDETVEVDSSWMVSVQTGELKATVRRAITRPALPDLVVLPGVYAAQVRALDERVDSTGITRRFEELSNFIPFTIAPFVEPLGVPDGEGVLTVKGMIFQHEKLSSGNLQVYIAQTRLAQGTYDSLSQGEFAVRDENTLQIRLPGGLQHGISVPFRLIINGAESQPQWVAVP
jgi:hypothetical protein